MSDMKISFRSAPTAWFLLVLGFVLFSVGVVCLQSKEGSAFWSSVSGEVIASRTVIQSDEKGSVYIPIIRYRYDVRGQTFEGDRVTFSQSFSGTTEKAAEEILSRYPAGDSVRVFYNSINPKAAVLVRDRSVGGWLLLVIGFLSLLAGGIAFKLKKTTQTESTS